jgi:hypothetical protein
MELFASILGIPLVIFIAFKIRKRIVARREIYTRIAQMRQA